MQKIKRAKGIESLCDGALLFHNTIVREGLASSMSQFLTELNTLHLWCFTCWAPLLV